MKITKLAGLFLVLLASAAVAQDLPYNAPPATEPILETDSPMEAELKIRRAELSLTPLSRANSILTEYESMMHIPVNGRMPNAIQAQQLAAESQMELSRIIIEQNDRIIVLLEQLARK